GSNAGNPRQAARPGLGDPSKELGSEPDRGSEDSSVGRRGRGTRGLRDAGLGGEAPGAGSVHRSSFAAKLSLARRRPPGVRAAPPSREPGVAPGGARPAP